MRGANHHNHPGHKPHEFFSVFHAETAIELLAREHIRQFIQTVLGHLQHVFSNRLAHGLSRHGIIQQDAV